MESSCPFENILEIKNILVAKSTNTFAEEMRFFKPSTLLLKCFAWSSRLKEETFQCWIETSELGSKKKTNKLVKIKSSELEPPCCVELSECKQIYDRLSGLGANFKPAVKSSPEHNVLTNKRWLDNYKFCITPEHSVLTNEGRLEFWSTPLDQNTMF